MRVIPAPVRTGRQGPQNGRAVRRGAPAVPAPQLPAAARVKGSRLPAGHPLKVALAALQLEQVPGSLPELYQHCALTHPDPGKTWGWPHVRGYRLLFDLISAGTGSPARSAGGPGRLGV